MKNRLKSPLLKIKKRIHIFSIESGEPKLNQDGTYNIDAKINGISITFHNVKTEDIGFIKYWKDSKSCFEQLVKNIQDEVEKM